VQLTAITKGYRPQLEYVMPTETSIPCSKEVRDLVKSHKEHEYQPYDELLREVFEERDKPEDTGS
jgi:hypothetical protein